MATPGTSTKMTAEQAEARKLAAKLLDTTERIICYKVKSTALIVTHSASENP